MISVHDFFTTPHDNPPRWIFMLTAYLDESGHESKDAVIVAGFLGNEDQWKNCAEQWRKALGQRKSFHATKLRFKKDRERRLLKRLGSIPHDCGLTALLAFVRVTDYDDLVSGTLAEKLTKGYFFCLITIFDSLRKNTPSNEAVKIILETQTHYEKQAKDLFDANQNVRTTDGGAKFSSIEFMAKQESFLTEPGDYLAFAMLQKYRDPTSVKTKWCEPIMNNTRDAFGVVHDGIGLREVIKKSLQKMPEFMKKAEKP